jgi:hypothetical protein
MIRVVFGTITGSEFCASSSSVLPIVQVLPIVSLVSKFSEVLYSKTNLVCTKYDFQSYYDYIAFNLRAMIEQPSWD